LCSANRSLVFHRHVRGRTIAAVESMFSTPFFALVPAFKARRTCQYFWAALLERSKSLPIALPACCDWQSRRPSWLLRHARHVLTHPSHIRRRAARSNANHTTHHSGSTAWRSKSRSPFLVESSAPSNRAGHCVVSRPQSTPAPACETYRSWGAHSPHPATPRRPLEPAPYSRKGRPAISHFRLRSLSTARAIAGISSATAAGDFAVFFVHQANNLFPEKRSISIELGFRFSVRRSSIGRSFFWARLTNALNTFGKMAGHSVARKGADEARVLPRTQRKPMAARLGLIR